VFILNPQSGIPIYRQLVEQIRRLVASGQLAPGEALPSVREVAADHAVNPMTVSRAYNLLETEGLLNRRRGKPMTVVGPPRRQTHLRQRVAQVADLAEELVLAAQQLQLDETDLIELIQRKWEDTDA
jgi:GntR family transcriptional regulator